MKIAVCSQNRNTITPHAGRCRHFMLFEIDGTDILGVEPLEIPIDSTLHALSGDGPHPLDGVQVLIAGSMGGCAVRKLAARGILGLITDETDPRRAVEYYLAGQLPAPQHQDATRGVCQCAH